MASEEDNFDIDIYGDGDGDGDGTHDYQEEGPEPTFVTEDPKPEIDNSQEIQAEETEPPTAQHDLPTKIPNPDDASDGLTEYLKQAPQQQGVKRKDNSDERTIDAGATNALLISDLHWWTTEDDVRGWANQASCEDELREVTFSEHKVNGKSKGQAFVEFLSPQASTATKHKIELLGSGQPSSRRHTVLYTSHLSNPFKTLPKDAPARGKDDRTTRSSSGAYNSNGSQQNNYDSSNRGYGGRGRGYNNRGNYNNGGTYNNNRSFSGVAGGGAGFNGPVGGGYQNNMPIGNFAGYNRGGMINNNLRGNMGGMMRGRGGMNAMMPMAGMGMAMNPMMNPMGMPGFQGNGNMFNPAMFNQGGMAPGGGDWSQHGTKRQRQE